MPRTMKFSLSASGLAVFAGAAGGGVLVGAEDVFGAEVAGAEAVGAGEDLGNFLEGDLGEARGALNGFAQRGADVLAQRVVGREGFVGALEDDDVLLALERASTMAASGKGRMTLTWMEPTLEPRVSRR